MDSIVRPLIIGRTNNEVILIFQIHPDDLIESEVITLTPPHVAMNGVSQIARTPFNFQTQWLMSRKQLI